MVTTTVHSNFAQGETDSLVAQDPLSSITSLLGHETRLMCLRLHWKVNEKEMVVIFLLIIKHKTLCVQCVNTVPIFKRRLFIPNISFILVGVLNCIIHVKVWTVGK